LRREKTLKKDDVIKKGYDPSYTPSGIKVRLHFCQNLRAYEKLTLRCSLQLGPEGVISQNNGEKCELQMPSVADNIQAELRQGQAVGVNRLGLLSVAAGSEIGQDPTINYGPVSNQDSVLRSLDAFEFTWNKDLHKLYWEKDGTHPVYFLMEVFGRLNAGGKRKVVAWAGFEILNRSDGKIQYGFKAVPLMQPPIAFDSSQ